MPCSQSLFCDAASGLGWGFGVGGVCAWGGEDRVKAELAKTRVIFMYFQIFASRGVCSHFQFSCDAKCENHRDIK